MITGTQPQPLKMPSRSGDLGSSKPCLSIYLITNVVSLLLFSSLHTVVSHTLLFSVVEVENKDSFHGYFVGFVFVGVGFCFSRCRKE